MSTRVTSGPTGWAVFAGTVLAIVGAFNVIYGLAAIFRDEVITTTGSAVIVWDVTKWGWILLIFGILQLLAGMALFAGASWARWVAVVLTARWEAVDPRYYEGYEEATRGASSARDHATRARTGL